MGKIPVSFAVERVNSGQVRESVRRISPHSEVRTDAFNALRIPGESHWHEPKATSPEQMKEWLPMVHVVISNFKSFLAGTFHGVSYRNFQEYFGEFVVPLQSRILGTSVARSIVASRRLSYADLSFS